MPSNLNEGYKAGLVKQCEYHYKEKQRLLDKYYKELTLDNVQKTDWDAVTARVSIRGECRGVYEGRILSDVFIHEVGIFTERKIGSEVGDSEQEVLDKLSKGLRQHIDEMLLSREKDEALDSMVANDPNLGAFIAYGHTDQEWQQTVYDRYCAILDQLVGIKHQISKLREGK